MWAALVRQTMHGGEEEGVEGEGGTQSGALPQAGHGGAESSADRHHSNKGRDITPGGYT